MAALTQTEIAKGLGVRPSLVTRYKQAGMPVDSVAAAAAWKSANVGKRIKPKPGTKPGTKGKRGKAPANPYADARTLREQQEAELARLAVLKMRGELMPRALLRAEVARHLSGLRDSILQIPARLQSVLAAETDETKVHDALQDELHAVLTQISEV